MKRARLLGATVLATALGVTNAGSASAHRHETQAQVWVTTVDRAELLHQRAPATFGREASDQPTIVVDPGRTYQGMDGFGASITDSSAAVLSGLSPATREQTLRELFDPRQGIGVSFLRQPVG